MTNTIKSIGFANKYYTLWNCSTEDVYEEFNGETYLSHSITHNVYIRNLSIDKDRAIEKSKKFGCINTEINENLKGKGRSFSITTNYERPSYDDNQFDFGKYAGSLITECEDLKYLLWYSDQIYDQISKKSIVLNRICDLDNNYSIDSNGNLISPIQNAFNNLMGRNVIFTSISNFNTCEMELEEDNTASIRVEFTPTCEMDKMLISKNPYGVSIRVNVKELNLVRRSYRGNDYYVPKGMRSFKGKNFKINNNNKIELV